MQGCGVVIRGVNKVVVELWGSVAVGLCDAEGFGGQERDFWRATRVKVNLLSRRLNSG
jgi:hypothetical protein